jgi:hypothetical protein
MIAMIHDQAGMNRAVLAKKVRNQANIMWKCPAVISAIDFWKPEWRKIKSQVSRLSQGTGVPTKGI